MKKKLQKLYIEYLFKKSYFLVDDIDRMIAQNKDVLKKISKMMERIYN